MSAVTSHPAVGDEVRLSWDEVRNHEQQVVVPTQDPQLPLTDIPPEAFERLCAELVDHTSGDHEVHVYGRRGQRQYGLDVVEFGSTGTGAMLSPSHVYQVKRYQVMTAAKLRDAVEVYAQTSRFKAMNFTVMTSARTDNQHLIDELGALRNEYADRFAVGLLGPDRIQTRLRKLPNTVRAVFGPAMALALCGEPGTEPPQLLHALIEPEAWIRTLIRAMAAEFKDDDPIRFNEAELVGPSVDSMFVDVPVVAHARTLAGQILADMDLGGVQIDWDHSHQMTTRQAPKLTSALPPPDGVGVVGPISLRVGRTTYEPLSWAGGAQALLHPSWLASSVIVGGPGQGKSTLLQYVCQVQRASHLGKESYDPDGADIRPTAAMPRVPFRVDLRLYAKWRRELLLVEAQRGQERRKGRRPKPRSMTSDINDQTWLKELRPEVARSVLLETYICERVMLSAGGAEFSVDDLVKVVGRWPVLFAFDGLDEIAPIVDRVAISDAIRTFRDRYTQDGLDVIVVVTSRPGVIERPLWDDPNFAVLELSPLVPALKMRYIQKWATSVELPDERRKRLLSVFEAEQEKPHVREVSSNPMQLAILCRLLDRKTVIPAQRTALYDEYIDVFFAREFEKNDTIREYRATLTKIHAYLGWWMHTKAEGGESNGTIDLETLRALLHEFLRGIGQPSDMVDELYNEMKTRVICLVQRKQSSGLFEFEVQGIREYFAARYLIDEVTISSGTKGDRLKETIRRPYWSNAMRFAAGMFSDGELPEVVYVCRELEQNEFAHQPLPRAAAKQLLDDHVFGTVHLSVVKDLIRDTLADSEIFLALDGLSQPGSGTFSFPAGPAALALIAVLKDRILQSGPEPERRAAATLLCRQLDRPDGDPDARANIWEWWWNGTEASAVSASEPALWLTVAAALRVLSDLTIDEEQRLAEVINDASQMQTLSVLELLARGGRWSPGEQLHNLCMQELADGVADGYVPPAPTTRHVNDTNDVDTDEAAAAGDADQVVEAVVEMAGESDPDDEFDEQGRLLISGSLGQLVRAARVDRYVESATLLGSHPEVQPEDRSARRRYRGRDKEVRATVATLDAMHENLRFEPNAVGWMRLLDSAEELWGDSWMLRAIVLTTPVVSTQAEARARKADIASTARIWPELARWKAQAERKRGDPDWWRMQVGRLGDLDDRARSLTTMFMLTTAVSCMNSLPLSRVGDELGRAADALTAREWAAVASACARAGEDSTQALRVDQQLRTTFKPSPRLGVLLLTRADDATVTETARHVLPGVRELWQVSPTVDALLRKLFVAVPAKVKLEHLAGARGSLPPGSIRHLNALRIVARKECDRILLDPGLWPADVVRSAAERAEARITAKLRTLDVEADTRGWAAPGV